MRKLTRDETAEPVSRDQILRHARGQGNIHFPCSADHEQDWQPYPVDPYSAICDDQTRFSLSMEMSRLTRDGTAEPVSRDQILRHALGRGNIHFPCSADHEQDWQPYPVDPYSAIRPAGLSSDLHPPRSIEGKSRTKLCQKRPQVPGLGHLQSYARFKGGKTKQGYQRMVGWCRLMVMVMADGDG